MMRWCLLLVGFFFLIDGYSNLKVLHLTFHNGCKKEVEGLAKELNFDLETWFIPSLPIEKFDGKTVGSDRYNIDAIKAGAIWRRNAPYFHKFDLIITSDTAPLARIFLQNNYKKPLIIWVCNRFDYAHQDAFANPFPDQEYYDLIRQSIQKPNVKIVSYTEFEHVYAHDYHNMNIWNETIQPVGYNNDTELKESAIPHWIDKNNTFFVPTYHNDTLFLNLSEILSSLQIPHYQGRYNGPLDIKDFKGIIHIPYAWSNLALFENWAHGLIYFIPSKIFLLKLFHRGNFFWSPPFAVQHLQYSEWYSDEHNNLFVYFDSWKDLARKVASTDYNNLQNKIISFHAEHKKKTIKKWKELIESLNLKLDE